MSYTVTPTPIAGLLLLKPQIFGDARGFFYESFNARDFAQATGVDLPFVQDNHSKSARGVLRGLHYQTQQPQAKLIRVIAGCIFDVTVDMRRSSPHFGQSFVTDLSAENGQQLWVPPGFAHGFLVTSDSAEVLYKTTDYYAPAFERSLRWDDPTLAIAWPLMPGAAPLLAAKDQAGQTWDRADHYL